jgi:hypothetical protein
MVAQHEGLQYHEVRYEDLLDTPKDTLSRICSFLGIDFSPRMLHLSKPSENLGDTKGALEIVRSNKGKYLDFLGENQQERLEQIVYSQAIELGYSVELATYEKPLGIVERIYLKLYDGFASLLFHIRSKGIRSGLNYFLVHYFRSSWRSYL